MLRRVFMLVAICSLSVFALVGCRPYHATNSYFDGALVIEYDQVTGRYNDDYMTYRFYGRGSYDVSFSITPEKSDNGADNMPENFSITITEPRELIKKQYILPDFLRVTVVKDGKSEYHDFA